MTQQDDPYVRLPYGMVEDPIYLDDQLFAWWARLKIDADGMYPAPASLPRRIPDDVVTRLVDAGHLLLTGPGNDRYFMRSVDEDRAARSAVGKKAAEVRWAAERARKAAAKAADDAAALHTHEPPDAGASDTPDEPEANAPERPSGVDANALHPHPTGHAGSDASPLRSSPSESSVAGPPARPEGGGPARLSDLLPPPPGHPAANGGRRKPADEELIEEHVRLLGDPRCSAELRRNAIDQLRVMGRSDLIPASPS